MSHHANSNKGSLSPLSKDTRRCVQKHSSRSSIHHHFLYLFLILSIFCTPTRSMSAPPSTTTTSSGSPLGPDGKPAKDPVQPASSSSHVPEIIEEPPEETVPERRDAPPLPMPPLVRSDNKFDAPAKRIFVQNTRTMPPLPALPKDTVVPPYAAESSLAYDPKYRNLHNTRGSFHLKDPIVEEENEEKEDSKDDQDDKEDKVNKDDEEDEEKDANVHEVQSERQRKREKARFVEEKTLLGKAAALEAEHDEMLIKNGGNEEAAKEEEKEEEEKKEEEESESEEGGGEGEEGKAKEEKKEEQHTASSVVAKLQDQKRLERNSRLKVDMEHNRERRLRLRR